MLFINTNGQRAFEGEFQNARSFSEGLAAVRLENRWTFIRQSDGVVAFEKDFVSVENFEGGLARVYPDYGDDPRIGYIDRNGDYVWYPTK